MRRGLKIEDIRVGDGDVAERGKIVIANVRFFLNHGMELIGIVGPRTRIDLGRRDCIAGLRYGIEGMREGGLRKITISPHLAYGAVGVHGVIPPNAVIRCEVELVEVREDRLPRPEDYPPGRQLIVFCPGEAAKGKPRWQFGLLDNGRCGITINYPIPGMTWHHTRQIVNEVQLGMEDTQELFNNAFNITSLYPSDCRQYEELWADNSEKGGSITRDRVTNATCLTIYIVEQGQFIVNFGLVETSQAITESPLFKTIYNMID